MTSQAINSQWNIIHRHSQPTTQRRKLSHCVFKLRCVFFTISVPVRVNLALSAIDKCLVRVLLADSATFLLIPTLTAVIEIDETVALTFAPLGNVEIWCLTREERKGIGGGGAGGEGVGEVFVE